MKTTGKSARYVPALLVATAMAIPAGTAVDLLTHASSTTTVAAIAPASTSSTTLVGSTLATGTATASTTSTSSSSSKTYVGTAEQNRFGTVQTTIVVTGNKITSVIISAPQDNPRSASINSYAVPILISETLSAQSANVDVVSGATYTSESFIGSLQAALAAAKL